MAALARIADSRNSPCPVADIPKTLMDSPEKIESDQGTEVRFGPMLSKKASIWIVMPLDVLLRSPPVVCGGIEVSTKVDAYTTNVGVRCVGAHRKAP